MAAGNASKKLTERANPAKKDGVSDAAQGTNPALPCCTGDKTAKRQADWNARARTTLKILNSTLRRPIIERPQCKPGRPFMTGDGRIIEVQGTAEKTPFSQDEFLALMELARKGVARLVDLQKLAVA